MYKLEKPAAELTTPELLIRLIKLKALLAKIRLKNLVIDMQLELTKKRISVLHKLEDDLFFDNLLMNKLLWFKYYSLRLLGNMLKVIYKGD